MEGPSSTSTSTSTSTLTPTPTPTPTKSSSPAITSSSSTTARPLYSSKFSSDQKGRTAAPAPSPVNSGNSNGNPKSSTPSQAISNKQAAPPQKAWTGAKNPITGRSQTPKTGSSSATKQDPTASLQEGQRVRITPSSGDVYEGIYANNPASDSSYDLKMVQPKKGPNSTESNGTATRRDNMSFQRKDTGDARVIGSNNNNGKNDGRTANGSRTGFRTDTAISNSRGGVGRDLQRWTAPEAPSTANNDDMGLEGGRDVPWNQFQTNERLFGIKTDYDENLYTTPIDTKHPDYHQRVAKAERMAREIERSVPVTAHQAEERVMDHAGGPDDTNEEDKYSGVQRAEFPPLQARENKYTPPARRAPTGYSTVKGAPVDPAIISSQLKAPAPKQTAAKTEENKIVAPQVNLPTISTPEVKPSETKPDAKPESKADDDAQRNLKTAAAAPLPPSDGNTPTSGLVQQKSQAKKTQPITSAADSVEKDVLASFKTFAIQQRAQQEKSRSTKARQDKEVKLQELKKFGQDFKLNSPVPEDLISIIAKDPEKQKAIQEKAAREAAQLKKEKAEQAAAAAAKQKQPSASKETTPPAKAPTESTTSAAATPAPAAADPRGTSRPTAPQHSSSPSAVPGRNPGARQSYAPQAHYQQGGYRGNRQNSQYGGQQQPGSQPGLVQRIRENKLHQPQGQHMVDNMRAPPTGPANAFDQYGRRLSGLPPSHLLQAKLNPNSHEFRPNALASAFNPAGPSQASSPRSAVAHVVEPHAPARVAPSGGKLIRRKTKAVDPKKCNILLFLKTKVRAQTDASPVAKPGTKPGAPADENDGIQPTYWTQVTWRIPANNEKEKPESTMKMTYPEFFAQKKPPSAAATAPIPSHVVPGIAYQQQLPVHLQGPQMVPRGSPRMPSMQMHNGQQQQQPGVGPMPPSAVPFNGVHPDDHRMMHSNSAQSFSSPRMAPMTMYPGGANMNSPAPMQYPQPYVNNGPPPMPQNFRHFTPQPPYGGVMPQQQHPMGPMGPQMMYQPQHGGYMTQNGMVGGPVPQQVHMYNPGQAHFMPGVGPAPGSVAGSNGFPSPGRPVAPMMAQQGSHQGYGVSPGPQYQQPYPQQPPVKYQGQRP